MLRENVGKGDFILSEKEMELVIHTVNRTSIYHVFLLICVFILIFVFIVCFYFYFLYLVYDFIIIIIIIQCNCGNVHM